MIKSLRRGQTKPDYITSGNFPYGSPSSWLFKGTFLVQFLWGRLMVSSYRRYLAIHPPMTSMAQFVLHVNFLLVASNKTTILGKLTGSATSGPEISHNLGGCWTVFFLCVCVLLLENPQKSVAIPNRLEEQKTCIYRNNRQQKQTKSNYTLAINRHFLRWQMWSP